MNPSSTYQQNRAALNQLMDFIVTDEFMELPASERKEYLKRLTELIKQNLPERGDPAL
jgi:hypothetical protein